MHDADVRRHDTAVLKRFLTPFQEHISLAITFQLSIGIEGECRGSSILVYLHGVIDNQVHLLQRIDLSWIASHLIDHVSHRRQVHNGRHSGEVLHQHARRPKSDFLFGLLHCCACREGRDVGGRDRLAVLESQQVFEHDLQRKRQFGYGAQAGFLGFFEREVFKLRVPDVQCGLRVECVHDFKILTPALAPWQKAIILGQTPLHLFSGGADPCFIRLLGLTPNFENRCRGI
jgi:hypothetical protein